MSARTDPMNGGSRFGRRWLLILSLAINLLLIGIVGVWVARSFFRGPPPPPEFGRMVERMSHRLSDADAASLRGAYDAHRMQIEKLTNNVRDSRRNVRRVLEAEPFDPNNLQSAMDAVRSARSAVEEEIQGVMRDGAAKMSRDGRRRLARGPRGGP
jgi:uncharacterized membrane protein